MKTIRPIRAVTFSFILAALPHLPVCGQGTAFTYHGRLNNNGAPVNGAYDVRLTLYDAEEDGVAVTGPLNFSPVEVANGLFTVSPDFGAEVFDGAALWLEIEVRPVGQGEFATLAPRPEITSSPYAIRALSAGTVANGAVAADQLNTGGVPPAAGQILSYDGGNLSWTDPGVAAGGIWSALNNNAWYSAGNVGIGTSTPAHRLSLSGGPHWTANFWIGGLSLDFATAIGWKANPAGQRFGMGHTSGGFFMFRTASDPGTTGSPAVYDFAINNSGNVGIGTTAPTSKLDIVGSQDAVGITGYQPFITFRDTSPPGIDALSRIQGVNGTINLQTWNYITGADPFGFIKLNSNGKVGIGSHNPVGKLEIVGQDALRMIGYQPFLSLYDSDAGYAGVRIQGVAGEMVLEAQNFIDGSNPNAYARLNNSGNLSVASLTIRGGADLAEPFEFSTDAVAPGSVVIIDDQYPGKLKLSSRAYDTRVAGIVSGANGVNPGISLHQEGMLEGGQNVALSGRVYVHADASPGAIKPGDLLTTADTPGHAMKVVDHARAQGAILGKAMTELKQGSGMVLVLVTLQ